MLQGFRSLRNRFVSPKKRYERAIRNAVEAIYSDKEFVNRCREVTSTPNGGHKLIEALASQKVYELLLAVEKQVRPHFVWASSLWAVRTVEAALPWELAQPGQARRDPRSLLIRQTFNRFNQLVSGQGEEGIEVFENVIFEIKLSEPSLDFESLVLFMDEEMESFREGMETLAPLLFEDPGVEKIPEEKRPDFRAILADEFEDERRRHRSREMEGELLRAVGRFIAVMFGLFSLAGLVYLNQVAGKLSLLSSSVPSGWMYFFWGGVFHFYQLLHARNFGGASVRFKGLLDLSCVLNGTARLVFLGLTWYHCGFYSVFGILVFGAVVFGLISLFIENLMAPYIISMLGFVAGPILGVLMFWNFSGCVETPDSVESMKVHGNEIVVAPDDETQALDYYDEMVSVFNQQAPSQIDPWTSMDSLSFDRDQMVMTYFSTMRSVEYNRLPLLATTMQSRLKLDYAEGGRFFEYKEHGVAVRMVYYLEHGTHWKTFQYPEP